MQASLYRTSVLTAVAFASGATNSAPVNAQGFAGGLLVLPASWGLGTLGYRVAPTLGGAYVPLYDKAGAIVATPAAASLAVEIHEAALAAHYFKLHGATSTTAGARTVQVCLKS